MEGTGLGGSVEAEGLGAVRRGRCLATHGGLKIQARHGAAHLHDLPGSSTLLWASTSVLRRHRSWRGAQAFPGSVTSDRSAGFCRT